MDINTNSPDIQDSIRDLTENFIINNPMSWQKFARGCGISPTTLRKFARGSNLRRIEPLFKILKFIRDSEAKS